MRSKWPDKFEGEGEGMIEGQKLVQRLSTRVRVMAQPFRAVLARAEQPPNFGGRNNLAVRYETTVTLLSLALWTGAGCAEVHFWGSSEASIPEAAVKGGIYIATLVVGLRPASRVAAVLTNLAWRACTRPPRNPPSSPTSRFIHA